jgi:hypothetical protein
MKKIIFLLLVFSGVLLSCKKNKCELNASNFTGTYKLVALTNKDSATGETQDGFSQRQACEKDDLTIFNSDGTIIFKDAGIVCEPDGNDTGVWSLNGDTLTIDGESLKISSFDCGGFTITISDDSSGEVVTATFKK